MTFQHVALILFHTHEFKTKKKKRCLNSQVLLSQYEMLMTVSLTIKLLIGVNEVGVSRCHTHTQEDSCTRTSCSFVKMHSVKLAAAQSHRATSRIYSLFHHRVHVLYYLWSHSGTAQCLSPTSYQEFVPGKLIRGERRWLSWRKQERLSCKWGPFLGRTTRCWRDEAEDSRGAR